MMSPAARAVAGLAMATVCACGGDSEPAPISLDNWAEERGGALINVLLLVLDTTRADAVGVYGQAGTSTPTLDRLAREGTLFTRARTTSAWTLPTHGSLFTGQYPSRHGAHAETHLLAAGRTTLAELLTSTHQTAGFSENPHISHAKGFTQGFDEYVENWRRRPDRQDTVALVESWLAERDADRPFFLFVNLMTPHLPYRPPARWQDELLPAGADARTVERLRAVGELDARRFIAGHLTFDDDELAILRALYRADVGFADDRAARLLSLLETAGVLERTLVVVVSDHGENLGEHGLMEHQLCLYETLLRVPMIFRLPGVVEAGRSDDAPVQIVDVMPTVFEAVGLPPALWPGVDGRSVLRDSPPPARPVIAEAMRPINQRRLFRKLDPAFDFDPYDRRLTSIQVGELKLIVSDRGPAELYDLASDPGETRNLAAEQPDAVAALSRQIEARHTAARQPSRPGEAAPELDPETVEALRALGYLD